MNEQLQQALATILGKTVDGIDTSVEFMQAELPEVIEQLLTWYAVKSFIMFSVSMLLVVAFLVGWRVWVKKCNESTYCDSFEKFAIPMMIGIFVYFFSLLAFSLDWLQIWIAPKIWLIEYAASLAK